MHGGVHREDDAECEQAEDQRDGRVGSRAQRDRDAGGERCEEEREPDRGDPARLRMSAALEARHGGLHDAVADHPDREERPGLPEPPAELGVEVDR